MDVPIIDKAKLNAFKIKILDWLATYQSISLQIFLKEAPTRD